MGEVVKAKGRQQLVLIIMLFSLPPLAAYVAWNYIGEHGTGSTNNAGILVHPARPLDFNSLLGADNDPLDTKAFSGRWAFAIFATGGCNDICQEQLYVTRQTRVSINKDMKRLKRLLILDQAPDEALSAMLAEQHKDLLVAVSTASSAAFLENFQGENFGITGKQYFLIDPIGNLMMFYDLSVNPRGIMKDLQKLLKVSQIG